jgi:hypothetical protein
MKKPDNSKTVRFFFNIFWKYFKAELGFLEPEFHFLLPCL